MSPKAVGLIWFLAAAILLAGCGGGGGETAAVVRRPVASGGSAGQTTTDVSHRPALTAADVRMVKSAALHNGFTREIAAGGRAQVRLVFPSLSSGGRTLLGGVAQVRISPPASFTDLKLPATIAPNEKAPAGTPTLHRYVRISASQVSELDVEIALPSGRAVRIEPSGEGYRVTKAELIGPPPRNPAYAPEPGA